MDGSRFKALLVKLILDSQEIIETIRKDLNDEYDTAADKIELQKNFIERATRRLEL